jgi:hypothetical protein
MQSESQPLGQTLVQAKIELIYKQVLQTMTRLYKRAVQRTSRDRFDVATNKRHHFISIANKVHDAVCSLCHVNDDAIH